MHQIGRVITALLLLAAGSAFAQAPKPAPYGTRSAQDVYDNVCAGCHATGQLGAPVIGDKEAWAPRVKQGQAALTASAVLGKNKMPRRGGEILSEDEVAGAVVFLANAAGANWKAAPHKTVLRWVEKEKLAREKKYGKFRIQY